MEHLPSPFIWDECPNRNCVRPLIVVHDQKTGIRECGNCGFKGVLKVSNSTPNVNKTAKL